MARYSRVALYNKAHNASHNQTNKTRPVLFRKNVVEIPEAGNSTEMQETIHHDLEKKENEFTPAVEIGSSEIAEQKKSARSEIAKRVTKKSSVKGNMKTAAAQFKKASSSKMKKVSAKVPAKKAVKKTGVKKAKTKPAKKAVVKKAAAKKMISKKMNKKTEAKSTMKKRSMKSK